jgi:hypothetical protein
MGAITVYVEVISPYVVGGGALPCDESRAHTHGAWSFDTVVTVTGPHGVKGRSNCAVGALRFVSGRARYRLSCWLAPEFPSWSHVTPRTSR